MNNLNKGTCQSSGQKKSHILNITFHFNITTTTTKIITIR